MGMDLELDITIVDDAANLRDRALVLLRDAILADEACAEFFMRVAQAAVFVSDETDACVDGRDDAVFTTLDRAMNWRDRLQACINDHDRPSVATLEDYLGAGSTKGQARGVQRAESDLCDLLDEVIADIVIAIDSRD